MNDPTTNTAKPYVEPYTRAAAQIIAAAVAAHRPTGDPVADATVARDHIRREWFHRYPQHAHGTTAGQGRRIGTDRLKKGLRDLEAQGVIERSPDTVLVLDNAKLAELCASEDTHEERTKRRGQ